MTALLFVVFVFGAIVGAALVIVLDVGYHLHRRRARGYVTITTYGTTGYVNTPSSSTSTYRHP